MSIRRGLRYGDDDDEPKNVQEYGTTNFDAGRDKTNFEKDVDNLFFGNMAPPVRRKRGDEGAADNKKPATTVTPAETKKPVAPPAPQPDNKKQPEPTKPSAEKPKTKPEPTPAPTKVINNFVQDKPAAGGKQAVDEQPRNSRQADSVENTVDIDGSINFNRPGYIRKLKKVAQDFNFEKQNSERHRFIEVLKPSETVRGVVKKLNSPDFQDHEFPPLPISIGHTQKKQNIAWKRPSAIFKNAVFGRYVDPNDISPGTLSSPQFLSTLSCLAEREENIKRLIENQKVNSNGFYFVRLNINGVWRYIAVDDYLPEQDGKAIGARSYNDSEAELWMSLVEKAYAKAYHGYSTFKDHKNTPREHYLRDLTGAAVRKYQTNDPDFNEIITEALGFGFPIVAVPTAKITDLGFNPNYSLSVLKSSNKGLQLRSSWGTIVERPKVSISKEGVFEITSGQLKDYISHVLIAETDSSLYNTTIQSKHHGSFYSCYSFKLNNPNPNGTITISQFDARIFSPVAQYSYSPFRVLLEKKGLEDQESHSLLVSANYSHRSRNLDLAVNLSPGTYYIYCIGQWEDNHYDYDLTVSAGEFVNLSKVNLNTFPNIISEALTQENLSNGKRAAKGSVDEYILYHEASNLVLVTALSLVDRAFSHTLNLQQVKPETLTLLNAVRPEDNFAKKTRKELQEYKDNVFNQKNWEVNLLPREKFTWVFSSSLDYDQANFKTWGFK